MRYIDMELKKCSSDDYKYIDDSIYRLTQEISKNTITIVLGAPGSGKTSILKKYHSEHQNSTQFITTKKFIKFEDAANEKTDILLIDAVDEYRNVTNDKSFVLDEIAYRLNKLVKKNATIKFVITCREMDWYGNDDEKALKDKIVGVTNVYQLLPLSETLQTDMAKLLSIKEPALFIKKFQDFNFLQNPQMFKMLAEIWQSKRDDMPESKQKIYETFILLAREHKIEHDEHIEENEMFRIVGYIAIYYIFCQNDDFDERFIDQISDSNSGYSRELILRVLKTKLFSERRFIHRTIAEYACAKFINSFLLQDSDDAGVEKQRTIKLFVQKGKIPTALRGTYAWLCSFSQDYDFIDIDPYYQIIYGDCSSFNFEQKKAIINAIKKHSSIDPYFAQHGESAKLADIYCTELDEYLICEFQNSIDVDTHYIYFIVEIIARGNGLSEHMRSFIKKCLTSNHTRLNLVDFIMPIQDDIAFLQKLLDMIIEKKIDDRTNKLKEKILNVLYPNHINSTEITRYIAKYQPHNAIWHFLYLYNTKYNDKFNLVDNILKLAYNHNYDSDTYFMIGDLQYFVKDYFLETLLMYDEQLSAKQIFDILIHFHKNYYPHRALEFDSSRYAITNKLSTSKVKLQKLTNELFSLYVDKMIQDDKIRQIFFQSFFDYIKVENPANIIFDKIHNGLNQESIEALFATGYYHLPSEQRQEKWLDAIASRHSPASVLHNLRNPPISEWQIRSDINKQERQKKIMIDIESNEKYFSGRDNATIQHSVDDLYFIAIRLFISDDNARMNKSLTSQTQERLTIILKNAIFSDLLSPDMLNIKSLYLRDPMSLNNIDTIYYVSLALNCNITSSQIQNTIFCEYLYMLTVLYGTSINAIHCDFAENIEVDFAAQTLKQYIQIALDDNLSDCSNLFKQYIEHESEISKLKYIVVSMNNDRKNKVLQSCLMHYGLLMSLSDLEQLYKLDINDENKLYIHTLLLFNKENKNDFEIPNAIVLYDIIDYDRADDCFAKFDSFSGNQKIKILDYMLTAFNTKESIQSVDGAQSSQNICASFLRQHALDLLNTDELQQLLCNHADSSIWHNSIKHKINILQQQEIEKHDRPYSITSIKDFITHKSIISYRDFFEDMYIKLRHIQQEIEDNRDNNKSPFYNKDTPKTENECRDEIVRIIKHKYSKTIDLSKESHEAGNRVDINIRYKNNLSYEVQVECKRDDNRELYTSIVDQLIKKYLSSKVEFGIYLVFYFGNLKDKTKMLEKIHDSIPKIYIDNIKVLCIDLQKTHQNTEHGINQGLEKAVIPRKQSGYAICTNCFKCRSNDSTLVSLRQTTFGICVKSFSCALRAIASEKRRLSLFVSITKQRLSVLPLSLLIAKTKSGVVVLPV